MKSSVITMQVVLIRGLGCNYHAGGLNKRARL